MADLALPHEAIVSVAPEAGRLTVSSMRGWGEVVFWLDGTWHAYDGRHAWIGSAGSLAEAVSLVIASREERQ